MSLSRFTHLRFAAIASCTIFVVCVTGVAWAKPQKTKVTTVPETQAVLPVVETPTQVLESLFAQIQKKLNAHEFESAEGEFQQLYAKLQQYGYSNASDYSLELLHLANAAFTKGETTDVNYLVEKAVFLSPQDARVLLAASSFFRTLGVASVQHFISALLRFYESPIMVVNTFLNVLLIGLLATTLALFIVCIVQFLCNMPFLLREVGNILPSEIAGLLGPMAVVAMFVVPLRCGILLALGGWTLLLEFFVKHCKRLALFSGILIGCWCGGIIILDRIGGETKLKHNFAIENIYNRNFSPQDLIYLEQSLQSEPDNSLLLFAYGLKLAHENDINKAIDIYQRLHRAEIQNMSLKVPILINLAALHSLHGEPSMALALLLEAEKLGNTSFELYYNLAQVSLALADLEKWREYYNIAKISEEARLKELEENPARQGTPLYVAFSSSLLFYQLFQSVTENNGFLDPDLSAQGYQLAQSLYSFGSVGTIGILAIIILILWINIRMSTWSTRDYSFLLRKQRKPSAIWILLPAGIYFSGSRPIVGALLLALVLGFLMAGAQQPAEVLPLGPRSPGGEELIGNQIFLWCALCTVIFITMVSIIMENKRKRENIPLMNTDNAR